MATYFTDFSEYTTGVAPADWTRRFGTFATNQIVTAAEALGGKVYRLTCNATAERRVVTWDDIPTDSADVEILLRVKGGVGAAYSGLITRQSGASSGALTGVSARPNALGGIGSLEIVRYVSGAATTLKTDTANGITVGDDIYIRQRANGQNHYGKYWKVTDPEPVAWTTISTSETATAAGSTGLFMFTASSTMDVEYFSAGTDGDEAPIDLVTRKITITDLKDPNDANSAIANATGVQVKLWVSTDSNAPIDTGAPDVLSTTAAITGGTMEVTFDTAASVGNPVLGVAKWTVSTDDYFFPIDTTVQEST